MAKTPNTLTRTDHAISIRSNGVKVGRIQDWAPQQARQVTPTYEINSASTGNVFENIPGVLSNLTINIVRIDLFNKKMEQAWGSDFNIYVLTDQTNPLTISESWSNPDGSKESWTYTGCWFTSLGRAHSANGDKITRVNATLTYTRKYKTNEIAAVSEELANDIFDWAKRKLT